MSEFSIGAYAREKSGAFWEGTVVGHYSTMQTPDGVAVQLFGWPNGPVQIYPAAALELCQDAGTMGSRIPKLGASFETVAAAYAQDERAALGIEAAFLAGAKFGAMRAANQFLATLPKRQSPETGEAMPGNASEWAGAPAPPPSTNLSGVRTVAELPMTAFADASPERNQFNGEQTILTYNDTVGVWDLAFFESGEEFPDKWFGDTHWIDITRMWPGVIAQVASFATTEGSAE